MMVRLSAAVALFLVAILLVSGSQICSVAHGEAVSDKVDFTGKIIALTIKDSKDGVHIQDTQLKQIGGRTFIVGKYAKRPGLEEFPDMTCWVPVDQIHFMTEYKNMEDAIKAHKAQTNRDR